MLASKVNLPNLSYHTPPFPFPSKALKGSLPFHHENPSETPKKPDLLGSEPSQRQGKKDCSRALCHPCELSASLVKLDMQGNKHQNGNAPTLTFVEYVDMFE